MGGCAATDTGAPPASARLAETLYRSDFFPGLGWMINAAMWAELGPKWPNGYWDDWLREPAQRKGRATIRPEVSRSYTFGEVGVSQSQFFSKYLATIKLNDVAVPWRTKDLSYVAVHRRCVGCGDRSGHGGYMRQALCARCLTMCRTAAAVIGVAAWVPAAAAAANVRAQALVQGEL